MLVLYVLEARHVLLGGLKGRVGVGGVDGEVRQVQEEGARRGVRGDDVRSFLGEQVRGVVSCAQYGT